jgi:hypothetical protein
VNIAFPDITRSFPGTPISALSWVLNAYNIVFPLSHRMTMATMELRVALEEWLSRVCR